MYIHIYIYIYMCSHGSRQGGQMKLCSLSGTPNLSTKNLLAKIHRLKISGKSHMDMRIPPRNIKILLESNLLNPESCGQFS